MAFKKREPKPDLQPKLQCAVSKYPEKTVVLDGADFATFARWIKTSSIEVALGIQAVTITNLKRLKVKAKGVEPVAGIPAGSDQINIGCLSEWAAKIEPEDKAAVEQLRRLGATVNARVS